MKRFLALLTALCLLAASVCAENVQTEDGSASGVTVWRNHQEIKNDKQEIVLAYPTFTCGDAAFEQFLTENVTDPICEMANVEEGTARGGYYASLDFDGVLSLEASAHLLPAGAQETEVELFYVLIDLNGRRFLQLDQLFTEPSAVVDEAICNAVYEQALSLGLLLDSITDSGLVPMPDSYFLTSEALRVLYDTQTLSRQAVALDLPWELLPLSWSPVLTGEPAISEPQSTSEVTPEPEETVEAAVEEEEPTVEIDVVLIQPTPTAEATEIPV